MLEDGQPMGQQSEIVDLHVCDVADCEQGFDTLAEVIAHEHGHRWDDLIQRLENAAAWYEREGGQGVTVRHLEARAKASATRRALDYTREAAPHIGSNVESDG